MSRELHQIVISEAVKILEQDGVWAEDHTWGKIGQHVCGDFNEAIARIDRLTTMCSHIAIHAAAKKVVSDQAQAFNLGDSTVVYLTRRLEIPSNTLFVWHDNVGKEKGLATLRAIAS